MSLACECGLGNADIQPLQFEIEPAAGLGVVV